MSEVRTGDVTRLLDAVRARRNGAVDELMQLVYGELRGLARRQMARARPQATLQATALVHEAYIRLFAGDDVPWEDRAHFFFAAARAMRDILVETARSRASLKRGGGRIAITLDEAIAADEPVHEDLITLDEVLGKLEATDRTSADVVMLRYFAGLSVAQTANAMGLSPATVKRHWQYARAWIRSQMEDGDG
ncbi:MAG: ECF-type sigma factor [Planctomycetota bacterium]|jgi:RNA polymerase sigma factor (TIGR02999 family)